MHTHAHAHAHVCARVCACACVHAAGKDYGRLNKLKELGCTTNISQAESLVLATSRAHMLGLKVAAFGFDGKKDNDKTKQRLKLRGGTIIFDHEAENVPEADFGDAVIRAALKYVNIQFVGPSGAKGKLERTALMLDDLRLQPDVLWNGLVIREMCKHAYENMTATPAHTRSNSPCSRLCPQLHPCTCRSRWPVGAGLCECLSVAL